MQPFYISFNYAGIEFGIYGSYRKERKYFKLSPVGYDYKLADFGVPEELFVDQVEAGGKQIKADLDEFAKEFRETIIEQIKERML